MACPPGRIAFAFNAQAPEAAAWAERHAATLTRGLTMEAQAAVRQAVVLGFENQIAPAQTARLVRASIGLTPRDAGAVVKRHAELLSRGLDARTATRRSERYAAKLLRRRSLTIARTETMRAANEGQLQLWKQAETAGLLERPMKVWITADPCPICEPLEGEVVGLDETFSIGGDPPAHPNCRCVVSLVANDERSAS